MNDFEQHDITPITDLLAQLRGMVRRWIISVGLGKIVTCTCIFILASLFIDRLADMDRPQRAIILTVGIIAAIYLVFRKLVRPLNRNLSDDSLCLRIEKHSPRLNGSMISALQLARTQDIELPNSSPALVKKSIESGVMICDTVNLDSLIDSQKRKRVLLLCAISISIVFLNALLATDSMRIWFLRNILLTNTEWPKDTKLTIIGAKNGVIKIPEQSDLQLKITADNLGVIPAEVRLEYETSDGEANGDEQMSGLGNGEFRYNFKSVKKEFRLRASGGDCITKWVKVVLIKRPTIESLQLTAFPPAYTGIKPLLLEPGQSVFRLVNGSRINITGDASKKLSITKVGMKGKMITEQPIQNVNSFNLQIDSKSLVTGVYDLQVIDKEGISNLRPLRFRVRLIPDAKPRPSLKVKGIGDQVLTKAVIPLELSAEDDFALNQVWLDCQIGSLEEKDNISKKIKVQRPPVTKRVDNIKCQHRLDLVPMNLKEGSNIMLNFSATDNDTVTGPKTAQSPTISIRVVSEEELRADFIRREQDLRAQFESLIQSQRENLEKLRIDNTLIPGNKETDKASKRLIYDLVRKHKSIIKALTGMERSFSQIYAEVVNNRIEEPEGKMQKRISEGIITPLHFLRSDAMQSSIDALAQQENALANITDLPTARQSSEKAIQKTINLMLAIRKNMVKSENYQELINTIRALIKKQRELYDETKEEKGKILEEGIFD